MMGYFEWKSLKPRNCLGLRDPVCVRLVIVGKGMACKGWAVGGIGAKSKMGSKGIEAGALIEEGKGSGRKAAGRGAIA
jgi:hypothetical protein